METIKLNAEEVNNLSPPPYDVRIIQGSANELLLVFDSKIVNAQIIAEIGEVTFTDDGRMQVDANFGKDTITKHKGHLQELYNEAFVCVLDSVTKMLEEADNATS